MIYLSEIHCKIDENKWSFKKCLVCEQFSPEVYKWLDLLLCYEHRSEGQLSLYCYLADRTLHSGRPGDARQQIAGPYSVGGITEGTKYV